MCPKRLPEPANAGPLAGGRRASLARRAEHPRSYGTAGSAAGKFCCAKDLFGMTQLYDSERERNGLEVLAGY